MKNIVLLVIFLLGVGFLGTLFSIRQNLQVRNDMDQRQKVVEKETEKQLISQGKISKLLESDKSYVCHATEKLGSERVIAELYLTDENGVITIERGGEFGIVSKITLLKVEDELYMWEYGSFTGFRMKYSDTQEYGNNTNPLDDLVNQRVLMDKEYLGVDTNSEVKAKNTKLEFKCEDWKPEESKFKLPETIEFKDMEEIKELFLDSAADRCDMCTTLKSEEEIQECLEVFNCTVIYEALTTTKESTAPLNNPFNIEDKDLY